MFKTKPFRAFVVGLSVLAVILVLHYSRSFEVLEWKSWDLRLQLLSDASRVSHDIILILIDQESLDVYSQEQDIPWPWPRQMYIPIIKHCSQGGAKSIFFDLTFTESSSWGVEDDQLFSKAIAEAGNVFLPIDLREREKAFLQEPLDQLSKFVLQEPNIPASMVYLVQSATLPVPELLSASRGVGNVIFSPDSDGIFRRLPLVFSLGKNNYPALALSLAEFLREESLASSVPVDKSGQMVIRYHGPTGTYPAYSAAAIINSYALMAEGQQPQIPLNEFQDKIVMIGGSASGLLDLRPTPFSAVSPGVEIHAAALDNLLQGDPIRVTSDFLFVFLISIFALLVSFGTTLLQKIWKITLFAVVGMMLPAALAVLAFSSGFWLEFVAPEFAVILTFTTATLLNYSLEGRERRFIKRVFQHYLNRHVVEKIIQNPDLLQLGGERREVTSFFSDVAGFTRLSEALDPEELVHLLNEYLSEMTDIILESGGTLDKYEGDAIIAFWNAPLDLPDHAERACNAVLRCHERLGELNPHFQKRYGHELSMRIGLNSGPAIVGNMGSRRRFDYTAMGDTINLAARLEGACKQYRIHNLIGEGTYEEVHERIIAREVDRIRVVGKDQPVRVYEILGEKSRSSSGLLQSVETFHQALDFYRSQEWDKSLELLASLGDDALVGIYKSRIQQLKLTPPAGDWDGVHDLTKK